MSLTLVFTTCRTHFGDFDKFEKLRSVPEFLGKLQDGKRNPTRADSMTLHNSVWAFTQIAVVHVPWGAQERKSEIQIGGFVVLIIILRLIRVQCF